MVVLQEALDWECVCFHANFTCFANKPCVGTDDNSTY